MTSEVEQAGVRRPWGRGSATGIGSLPGTDVGMATRLVRDAVPLAFLPELPARGPGADMLGRAGALLVDLHVDLQPSGWRFVDRPGLDERRALSWLDEDLDVLEEVFTDYTGPLKLAVTGPWTLAAGIELARGNKALSDPGACRDITASLAEGLSRQVAQVRRRIPGAAVVVQLDEPSLPAVLDGRVKSASGWDRLRAVDPQDALGGLRAVIEVLDAADVPVVAHCCAPDPPVELFVRAGAAGVSVDALALELTRPGRYDEALGELLEAGIALFAGVVPAVPGVAVDLSDVAATVAPVRSLWGRLGLEEEVAADMVVLTPTCGQAGSDPATAAAVLTACAAGGRVLADGMAAEREGER